jgi:transposase
MKMERYLESASFHFSREAIERFLYSIPSSEITITIEACGIWRGAYKVLADLGYEVKLANLKKTHEIACRKKTDKVDARILADLLRTNYLPEVWIPDEQVLKLRRPHKTQVKPHEDESGGSG